MSIWVNLGRINLTLSLLGISALIDAQLHDKKI